MNIRQVLRDELPADGGDDHSSLGNALNATFDELGKDVIVDEPSPKETVVEDKPAPTDTPTEDPYKAPPKSWKQEMHPHWEKTPAEVRKYWNEREGQFLEGLKQYDSDRAYAKALREAVTPYQPLLEAQGIKEHQKAVQFLLSAHQQLSDTDPNKRMAFFRKLTNLYNVDPKALATILSSEEVENPALQSLSQEVNTLKSHIAAEQNARFQEAEAKVSAEVDAFSKDPAHLYFDEVADDIAILLRGSDKMTLKDAYERAVWANPVTRAKEQARVQKDAEATLRKQAEEKAAAKLKARGTQVRGQDADRGPTDPLGSIEDTMRETYQKMQSRTH